MDALLGGLRDALSRGPAGGYPMAGFDVAVTAFRRFADRTTPGALRLAAASAVARAAREAGSGLLEPVMDAEISAPEAYVGTILNDLTANRRAHIRSVDAPSNGRRGGGGGDGPSWAASKRSAPWSNGSESGALHGRRHEVRVTVPLRELLGYATALRSISAGEASFTMELGGYERMDAAAQATVLEGEW